MQNKINLQENLNEHHKESGQKISVDGKIVIPKIGWMLRISTIVGISGMLVYYFIIGLQLQDPLILFSIIMPLQELIIVSVG